jgi:uncharacterized protein (DUF58 family)
MGFRNTFPGFKLRLTRWGGGFLIGVLVLALAAVNTGNNALMMLLGVTLGAYLVSGLWSRQVLAGLEVKITPPQEIYAGRRAVLEVELMNRSRWFPAYGVVIRDHEARAVVTEGVIRCGEVARHAVETVFPRRGRQLLDPWRIEVLLPLGFFLKSKETSSRREILVYPRLLRRSRSLPSRAGQQLSTEVLAGRGREGEVTQLRAFAEGDEMRQVHWKQTARQQRMIVVERQRLSAPPVVLVLDPRAADPDEPRTRDRFERLVSEIATTAVERLENGQAVGLVVGPTVIAPVVGGRQAGRLLRPLAEVEVQPLAAPQPASLGARRTLGYRLQEAV